jgi:hypothetical protein
VDGIRAFYGALADALESQVPQVDFDDYAARLRRIETDYSAKHARLSGSVLTEGNVEVIRNPRALCVSSQQSLSLGFQNQLQKVIESFPATVRHDVVLDSQALRDALTQDRYDVVHIGAFICPRSGDVYFSSVDLHTGAPASQAVDTITADALAALLKISETKLVVITSCDSVALAATLIASSHVVAARDMVSANMMAAWVDGFYGMLTRRPLSQALDFAIKSSGAPMRLYARQPAMVDLVLEVTPAA